MPPEDSRGTTSVVAIPTPSLSVSGQNPIAHALWIAEEETLHYTAARSLESRQKGRPWPGGTCIETREKFAASRFGLVKLSDRTEFIVSCRDQFGRRKFLELGVMFLQADIEQIGGSLVIAVSSA